jgi:hypothetical protein
MNPLAVNWAQLLAMAPVTVAWIAETSARDVRIRRGLDDAWQRLLTESEALARLMTGHSLIDGTGVARDSMDGASLSVRGVDRHD